MKDMKKEFSPGLYSNVPSDNGIDFSDVWVETPEEEARVLAAFAKHRVSHLDKESFEDWKSRSNLGESAAEFLPAMPPPGHEIVEGDILRKIPEKDLGEKDGESFSEMCERLGLDPRCTCTFGLGS